MEVILGSAPRCDALPAWTTAIRKEGYCATYSLCGQTEAGKVPCPANIEAQPITDEVAHTMSWFCPVAWEHVKENGLTCCNGIELESTLAKVRNNLLQQTVGIVWLAP